MLVTGSTHRSCNLSTLPDLRFGDLFFLGGYLLQSRPVKTSSGRSRHTSADTLYRSQASDAIGS